MNACCVIPQQQWQKHCSVAELTAPFYFGMHSALGEEPAEVSKMTCSKSVCSMLHEVLDAELVEYADLLTWNPVEQIAMSNVYDIDRRLSSYDKIPCYLREDLSLSNTKKFWTSGVQEICSCCTRSQEKLSFGLMTIRVRFLLQVTCSFVVRSRRSVSFQHTLCCTVGWCILCLKKRCSCVLTS